MVDSLGTSAKTHFNRAVDLYDHFSEQHDVLRKCYQTLLKKRIALMKPEDEAASCDALKEHVCALTEFTLELMKFAKPAGGKLAKLFSVRLCKNLANCLFIDLALDMHHYHESSDCKKLVGSIKRIWKDLFPNILEEADWATIVTKNLFEDLRGALEYVVSVHDEQMNENVKTVLKSRTEGVWLELKNQHEPLGIYTDFEVSPESAEQSKDEESDLQCPETLEDYFDEVGSLVLLSLDLLDFNSFTEGRWSIGALKILLLLQAVYMKLPARIDTEQKCCLNPQLVLREDRISEFLHHCGMNRENLNPSAVKNFLENVKPTMISVSDPEEFKLLTREEIFLMSTTTSYLDSLIVKFIVNTVRICSKSGTDERSVIECVTDVLVNLGTITKDTNGGFYFGKYFYLSCALLVQSKCEILRILPLKIQQLNYHGPQDLVDSLFVTYLRIIEYVTAGKISAPVLYEYMKEVKENNFYHMFYGRFRRYTKKDFVEDCLCLMAKIITNVKSIRSEENGVKGDVHHAGEEFSSVHTGLHNSKACTVAMLSSVMLGLFEHDKSEEVEELLSTAVLCLTQCRLCCCLSAKDVLPFFDIWDNDFVLSFVKNVILVDLSGVENYYSDECSECARESIVMRELEDGDTEYIVKGEYIEDTVLAIVDKNKVKLVPDVAKDYLEIKWWKGLDVYCSGLQGYNVKLKKTVQHHFYQILVQSKRQIRQFLYTKIYEPALKEILNDFSIEMDKDAKNEAIVSRAYVFRALHYIIISDSSTFHYTLSSDYWRKFLNYFGTLECRETLPLACAMYSYVGALVMSDCTGDKDRRSPLLEDIKEFFLGHFIEKNELWCQGNNCEKESLHVRLLGVAKVYSTMEEFCTFTHFRSVLLEAKLRGNGVLPLPVQTLLWTVRQLATDCSDGDENDHILRNILVSECPSLCSSLLRSLMLVVSLCGNMSDHIKTVIEELPNLRVHIGATEPLWGPFLSNLLGVNFTQLPAYMCGLVETSCDDFTPLEAGWEHHISKLYRQKVKRKECPQFLEFCLRSLTWIHGETKDVCHLGKKGECTEQSAVTALSSYFSSLPSSLPSFWGTQPPEPINYKETIGPQPGHCQLVSESLRLVRLVCEADEALHQFVRPFVMEELLSDYWDVLGDGEKHQAVVKEVLLLWFFFAKQQLATKHLQQFMKLFMEKKPPVRSMVSVLRTLLKESIDDVTALAPITGTVEAVAVSHKCYSVSGNRVATYHADGFVMNASAAPDAFRLHSVREEMMLCDDSEQCGLTLSRAVMLLPKAHRKEWGNWAPFITPTTIATWIRVDVERVVEAMKENSGSDTSPMKVHIHSAGVKGIHATVCLNLLTESATSCVSGYFSVDVYLYVPQNRSIKRVSKTMKTKTFDFNSEEPWHFLMMNYKGFNPKKEVTLTAGITFDSFVETLTSKMNRIGSLAFDLPFVSVGHFSPMEKEFPLAGVSLGNVWVFASDNDGPYRAPILRAFGPSARNFLCPRGSTSVSSFLLRHMGHQMVEAIDESGQEFVMNMEKNLLNELQGNNFMNSLAMQFNCHNPDVFSVYSKPSSREYSYSVGNPEYTIMYGGSWESKRPKQRAYGALMELGGVEHLLVLQARIAELNPFTYDYTIAEKGHRTSSSNLELQELLWKTRTFYRTTEKAEDCSVMVKDLTSPKEGSSYCHVQAEALDLLMWSVKNSATFNEQFSASKGYDMIVTLLCSDRMDLRLPVMKTLLSHCFSDLDLKPLKGDGVEDLQLGVLSQSAYCGLITNSVLLSTLLKCWPALIHKRARVTSKGMEGIVKDVCFGTLNSFELLLRVCDLATSSSMDAYRACKEINSNILLHKEAITTVFKGLKLLHTVDIQGYSIHPDLLGGFLKSLLVEEAQPTLTARQKLDKAIQVVASYLQLCVEPEASVSYKFNSCILSLDGLYDFYRSGLPNENPTSKTQEILHQQMFQKISDTISRPPCDRAPSPDEGFVMIEEKYQEMVKETLQSIEDEKELNLLEEEFDIAELTDDSGSKGTSEPCDLSPSLDESRAPSDHSASSGELGELSNSTKDESCEPSELSASKESCELTTVSGRMTPFEEPNISVQDLIDDSTSDDMVLLDSDEVRIECYIGDRVLTALVNFFLNITEDMQLRELLRKVFSPQTLCLLANHKSANVRIAVIKILQKVFSKGDRFRNWVSIKKTYMDCLENIKHQLYNREATDEIVDLTYDLMVSSKEMSLVPNLFLAALSRMSLYKDFNSTRKVLDFAHLIANEMPAHADQILGMKTLSESLLLSLKSILEEPAFNPAVLHEMTVAFSNLVRISICVKDVQSVKDNLVKVFLLCHFMRRRDVSFFTRALTIFTSCVVNALAILFAFINLEKGCNTLNGSEYSSVLLPLSRELCLFVAKRVAAQGVNPVLKSLEILSLVQNALYNLGLLEVNSSVGVTPLHWFLLDLQLLLLNVWDNSANSSNRAEEKRQPKSGDLLHLSLRFSSPMRSLLPQTLYFLSHEKAGVEANSALINRLSGDMNVTRKLFLYVLADESELGRLIMHNLNKMVARFYLLPLHSACETLSDLAQTLSNLNSKQLSELSTAADEKYTNYLKVSGKDSDAEMSKCAQESHRKAVKDHKTHKETLFLVYNEFLVNHIDLKSLVMNEVQAFEDLLCRCVISWRSLASTHSRRSSTWTRNLNAWIELRNNINSDMTRTVLEPQTRKLNVDTYFQSYDGDFSDPFNAVFDALIPNLPYGETRTTIPRYEPNEEFMAKGIEPVADFKCWVIRHGTDFFGNLFMFQENLVFNGTKQVFSCGEGGKADEVCFNSSFSIDKDSIREIRLMKYRLEEVAIEVYLKDGISWFFAFESEGDRTSLMNHLKENWSKLATSAEELKEAKKNWIDRKISNFEYLMKLNLISGRTYNDLCQYPVFPFVLSLYSSDGSTDDQDKLDLNEETSFRNLEYPLPAQLEDKKKKLEERYKNCADPNVATKYHYSSFYSNSTIVQNYLIRVPPFTLYHVKLQGGKFDNPDRIFHSVSKTYKISVTENDSREAIPELYYLPELFTNEHQKFAFELREGGDSVEDVKVPQWCETPRDFVLMHRAALESSKVTEKLHNWIDLVFGCKQSGERAFKSYNTYHPYCYSDIMKTSSESKELFKAFARCVGDAPRQLFKDPHPKAKPEQSRKSPFLDSRIPMKSLLGMEWGSFAFFTKDKEFTLEPPKKMKANQNHRIATNVPGDTFFLVSEGVSILHLAEESNYLDYHMVRIDPYDGVVRAQSYQPFEYSSREAYPIVKIPSHLTVTRFIVDESYLWVGCDTGTVSLYTLQFSNNMQQYVCARVVHLKHHIAAVTAISSLKDFGICVTGDASGVCCIWDPFKGALINDPVTVHEANPINCLLISRTSGEWFSVVNSVNSSQKGRLSLHRINTSKPIHSKQLKKPVLALSMTNMKEGTGVNVVAAISVCNIVLLSSWDLNSLVDIPLNKLNPVTELLWSLDSSEMLAKWQDGSFCVYDSKGATVDAKVTQLSWK